MDRVDAKHIYIEINVKEGKLANEGAQMQEGTYFIVENKKLNHTWILTWYITKFGYKIFLWTSKFESGKGIGMIKMYNISYVSSFLVYMNTRWTWLNWCFRHFLWKNIWYLLIIIRWFLVRRGILSIDFLKSRSIQRLIF